MVVVKVVVVMSNETLKNLIPWKESLFRLSENKFLNIVRMYVGIIKTPYNKERLVNDLVSFLYKEEHKKTIIELLSEKDILFLSAVKFLEKPTNETLLAFFENEYTTFYLYDYIANLEERLLLYRYFDERTKKEYLSINPLLQAQLEEYLCLSVLIPLSERKFDSVNIEKHPTLGASLYCSWYAFIAQYPDACRADGSFKKKTLTNLETVFYGVSLDFLAHLNTAFVHLGLFFHDGSNLCIHEKKWKAFSTLTAEEQRLYICVASFRRFSREVLVKHTNFVKNLIEKIPSEGLCKTTIARLGFILKNTQKGLQTEKKAGFFANMLQRAQSTSLEEEGFSDKALLDKMEYFGLLTSIGQDKNGNDILVSSYEGEEKERVLEPKIPFVSLNAGYSVTFLVTVSLETMLPLVSCMNLESFDTVCRFEITRASCMRSFDKGETNESLLKNLEKASGNTVSQNLTFTINEWFETYNSAALYHGFVLQVSQEKIIQIENNAFLAKRIKKVLAPGIYIFDFETREEMMDAVEKSSLDFIGLPKNSIKESDVMPFNTLKNSSSFSLNYENIKKDIEIVQTEHSENMKKELEKLNLPVEQKEGLLERINRKLIITPKQLIGETVRSEKTEASGIDFMGKIQVIEQAIASSNMIEIVSAAGVFVGRPVKIDKKDADASITLSQEDQKTITLLIGQARNVKRFRQPLY